MHIIDVLNPANFMRQLPTLGLLFILFLILVTIYVLDRSVGALRKLRALSRAVSYEASSSKVVKELIVLGDSLAAVRQVLLFASYVFGCVLFLLLAISLNSVATSGRLTSGVIVQNFWMDFALAADVFLVFTFLHAFQWIISTCIDRAIRRASS